MLVGAGKPEIAGQVAKSIDDVPLSFISYKLNIDIKLRAKLTTMM